MFNFSKVGEKIAIIDKSLKHKRQNKVYMNNKSSDDEFIKEFKSISIDDGEFILSPDKDIERQTLYCCGSAGSGKSYFVAQYVARISQNI